MAIDKGAAGGLEGLLAIRRAKLEQLRRDGDCYPNDFRPSVQAADLTSRYGEADDEALADVTELALAGRLMLRRIMGGASFALLRDVSGDIQIYLRRQDVGEAAYELFVQGDIGDLVGVQGRLMRTRKGELTVQLSGFRLLTKALRPLPEKYHGLSDRESRVRQPYLGLILEGRGIAAARARMNACTRGYLESRSYLEVETPMMQPLPGGASAMPFVTHHNALGRDLYLRVAPELYLKMLLVGGLDRVYELNRNFRNEGVSSRHNPEFTMLEFYRAWADWQDGMDETEGLMREVFAAFAAAEPEGVAAKMSAAWPEQFERRPMAELVAEQLKLSADEVADEQALRRAASEAKGDDWGSLLLEVFEKRVEPKLKGPIIVTHFPLSVSPLARACADAPLLAERWELFAEGREIAAGYSELNDPQEQEQRFERQAELRRQGDAEAMPHDRTFIEALEYGMPPAAGVGIGMDRLLMLLTGSDSIRDIILFPHLRERAE